MLSLPVIALPIVVIQFAKRAGLIRFVLPATLAIVLPPIFATTHLTQDGAFFVAKRPDFKNDTAWSQVHLQIEPSQLATDSRLPITIRGLPPGFLLRGEGKTRIGLLDKPLHSSLFQENGNYYLRIDFFGRGDLVRGRKVSLQTDLDIWVLNDKPLYNTSVTNGALVKVPYVGLCTLDSYVRALRCWNGPVRPPETTIRVNGKAMMFSGEPNHVDPGRDAYLYYQLSWDFTPIETRELTLEKEVLSSPSVELSFAPHSMAGRFHATIRAENYSLSDAVSEFGFASTPK